MDVICGVCGQRNPPHRRFCSACSRYLDENSQRVPSDAVAPVRAPAHDDSQHRESADFSSLEAGPGIRTAEPAARPYASPGSGLTTAPCPRCATENRTHLRFCRKCGHFLADTSAPVLLATSPQSARAGWWQRLKQRWRRDGSSAARTAYRRSLPLRYRMIRWATVGALLLAAVTTVVALTHGGTSWVHRLF